MCVQTQHRRLSFVPIGRDKAAMGLYKNIEAV